MPCSRALEAGRTGDAWTPGGGYEPVAGLALHPYAEMTVRPLIYGYLRVWTDTCEQEAARTETKDIVIPDLSHFCPFHDLGETMKAIIEHIAGARVWTIRP